MNTFLLMVTLLAHSLCTAVQISANHLHIGCMLDDTTCMSESPRGELTLDYTDILSVLLSFLSIQLCGSKKSHLLVV